MDFVLIKSEDIFVEENNNVARLLTLQDCIAQELLLSPDTKQPLQMKQASVLTDGITEYPLISNNIPLLYPQLIRENWQDGQLPLANYAHPLLQYVLLSQIKQAGEINAPLTSHPVLKHKYRLKAFCKEITGLVLDVGCDYPSQSKGLFSNQCAYIGLDPYAKGDEFRLVGLGEILPIQSARVDAVVFNTSLDHILDYHTAIEEAARVLKPDGKIIIATYAWLQSATLLTDAVHFHHFREYELIGALERAFHITGLKRYEDPKHHTHRYGLYLEGEKRAV